MPFRKNSANKALRRARRLAVTKKRKARPSVALESEPVVTSYDRVEEGIALITLRRPEKLNAFDEQMALGQDRDHPPRVAAWYRRGRGRSQCIRASRRASAGRSARLYPRHYIRELETHSPFRFAALRLRTGRSAQ